MLELIALIAYFLSHMLESYSSNGSGKHIKSMIRPPLSPPISIPNLTIITTFFSYASLRIKLHFTCINY